MLLGQLNKIQNYFMDLHLGNHLGESYSIVVPVLVKKPHKKRVVIRLEIHYEWAENVVERILSQRVNILKTYETIFFLFVKYVFYTIQFMIQKWELYENCPARDILSVISLTASLLFFVCSVTSVPEVYRLTGHRALIDSKFSHDVFT